MAVVAEVITAMVFESHGWRVLQRGWPDMLCLRGEEARAVEVKVKGAGGIRSWPSPEQLEMHAALQFLGIPVHVVRLPERVPRGGFWMPAPEEEALWL